jgi:hypothetical protein
VYDNPNNAQGLTSQMLAYFVQPSAGATGVKTATASYNDYWVAQQIAIRTGKDESSSSRNATTASTSSTSGGDPLYAEQAIDNNLFGYPNPVVDRLFIQFPEMTKQPDAGSINILDQVGRSYQLNAAWHSANSNLEIDFSTMDKGLYFIKVSTEHGAQTMKVIKK